MFKSRDMIFMDVFLNEPRVKKIGYIEDVIVDSKLKNILGFSVSPNNLFKFKIFIDVKDIDYETHKNNIFKNSSTINNYEFFKKEIYVSKKSELKGEKLKKYISLKVINKNNNLIGILNDIIFNENFEIIGCILWENGLESIKKGKRIICREYLEVQNNKIFSNENQGFCCYSLLHKL